MKVAKKVIGRVSLGVLRPSGPSITGLLSNDVPEWNIRSPGTPPSHPGMQSDFAQEIPSPLPPRRGAFSEAYPGPKEEEN